MRPEQKALHAGLALAVEVERPGTGIVGRVRFKLRLVEPLLAD